jgi:DNA repair protein RadA/Sms
MKTKTIFTCQNCGARSPRWVGKCFECGSWNTFVEETVRNVSPAAASQPLVDTQAPVLLTQVDSTQETRLITGIVEFDRVLGGGIVPGSVTLIGGDPGIGKSTLLLQVSTALSRQKQKVLYVSGEESVQQTKMRSDRIKTGDQSSIYIVNQLDLNLIAEHIKAIDPDVIVLDSIQVVYQPELSSSPGSVSQVRECAAYLTQMVKASGSALFLIGHVTKDGMLAGPRVLEHIVDAVLYFEGERYSNYRILRTSKNRFGSTNEIGVFEMTSTGLSEVANPSQVFLSERPKEASGSVVVPILEGTRPLLVEIQGLVSRSTFGVVRQKAQGFDGNRLALLVAVLEKRLNLNVQDKDIFLNVVGGVRIVDPAADLAVVVAIASALLDKVVPFDSVFLGEVGLSAEIRSVSQIVSRIYEAEKLGFQRCIVPKNNFDKGQLPKSKIDIVPVATVKEALEYVD